MASQEQQPKRSQIIWMRVSTGLIILLALLWRLTVWVWGILIIGIVIGVLGNALFTLLMTGKIDLTGTLRVMTWLYAHLFLCLTIGTPTLVITFCSYLAYHWRQRVTQENQRAHTEALVVVAKGVQRALDELNAKPPTFPPSLAVSVDEKTTPPGRIWNVPSRSNPFFTGREDVLKELHDNLISNKMTALIQPQAVSGLGGIGKTQTAVEYAYRHRDEYQAIVWIRADTEEILFSDIATLAQESLFNLPQKDEKEQSLTINAVINWFNTRADWLLIFDNVEDIRMIQTALFQRTPIALQYEKGSILLTTRSQATGTHINGIEIPKLDAEQGADFLTHRAKKDHASEVDLSIAKTISVAMDGLPLALDQAGAYIEETQCSFSHYLKLYSNQKERAALLKRRGNLVSDHPESVTATFALSFTKVQQVNPLAAEILFACAFLYPENIPEDILTKGVPELGSLLRKVTDKSHELDEALATLNMYSLVRRDMDNHMLSIHRLVQAVVQETMNENEQHQWAERTVRAIYEAFPQPDVSTWSHCQQYFPHASLCAPLIEQHHFSFPEAASLLHRIARYLQDVARYPEAEELYRQALAIRQKALGPVHPATGDTLHELARLYQDEGRYSEAEELYQKAFAIRQKLGSEHPATGKTLYELARLRQREGRYPEAEKLYQQALTIYQKSLGSEHPWIGATLDRLASLYQDEGHYPEAEKLYQQALAIYQKSLGRKHPSTKTVRTNYEQFLASAKKRKISG